MMEPIEIRRAILSVSDKTGLVELGQGLSRLGVELLSTGGTYRTLRDAGLAVTEVAEYTGFPEMLDGRVKTLHPKVHGGILYRRDVPEHVATIAREEILPFDLVVVNLYPFERTVAQPDVAWEEVIEQIDIGGPSMVRSAAKNHAFVAVLSDPEQYRPFLAELEASGGRVSRETRLRLAAAAFERTARYDGAIAAFLASARGPVESRGEEPAVQEAGLDTDFPPQLQMTYVRQAILRYGENPHQRAALYVDPEHRAASAVGARQRHGKELSYNNLLDLDAALSICREFTQPAAVVIKHNNPCGAAVAETLAEAFRGAHAGDPTSAFGSILGFNRTVDQETALEITEPDRFVEAVIAPGFSPEAMEILTTRPSWKKSVRLLETGDLNAGAPERLAAMQMRPLEGGMLRQSPDLGPNGFEARQVVTRRALTPAELRDLEFAWVMVKHVRSNAIVLAKDGGLVGVGAGQMSRVDATQIAIHKAGERARGAVLASDAFFPFRDSIDLAAAAGIVAIVQPGGSKRDQESIDAANEHGIAMLVTGMRHFRH